MSNYGNPSDAIAALLSTIFVSSFFIIYLIIIIAFLAIMLALIVFMVICNWKLLEKAGEPGWKSLIPFYNVYTIADISLTKPTSTVLFVIFCVSYIFLCIPYIGPIFLSMFLGVVEAIFNFALAKSFGCDVGMCIVSIFFSPIVRAILAFSKNVQYTGDKVTIFASNNQ